MAFTSPSGRMPSLSLTLPKSYTPTTDRKCFIGGCVRNCATYLPKVLRNIHQMQAVFAEIYVIIAYDESSDGSLDILRQFRREIANFDILVLQNPNPSPIRTERLAYARNTIFAHSRAMLANKVAEPEKYEYMCMIDMDDVCSTPMYTPVLSHYISRDDWDILSFNRDDYYDIWALAVEPYVFSCHHWGTRDVNARVIQQMTTYVQDRLKNTPPDELVEVYSAFNGFAIYRLSKCVDCRYSRLFYLDHLTPEIREANAVALGLPFPEKYPEFVEDCEHKYFHMEAIHKNGARIRVSPHRLFANTANWRP